MRFPVYPHSGRAMSAYVIPTRKPNPSPVSPPAVICAPVSQLPAPRPTTVIVPSTAGSATLPTNEPALKRPPLYLVWSNSHTAAPLPSAAPAANACVDIIPYVSQCGPPLFVASQPGRGSAKL